MFSRTKLVVALFVVLGFSMLYAQNTMDDVHLFQTFFKDATITKVPYGEGGLKIASYDNLSTVSLGVQGGYAINPKLEVGARLQFENWNPEGADSQSGISDILVSGRYLVVEPGKSKVVATAGGYITLPVGSDKIGGGKFNLGAFGAGRLPLENGIVITGCFGFDLLETETTEFNVSKGKIEKKTEHEFSILIGAGGIYQLNEQLHLIGELNIQTEAEYIMLSGGADYKLDMGGRVRGALGLGLDDGAPDFQLMGGFFYSF